MRQHYVLLLAVVVFLSSVNAASATTSSTFLTGDQVDSVTKRLLRTATAVNKDDTVDAGEERGIFNKLLTKLRIRDVKPKVPRQVDPNLALKVENKFQSLDLDLMRTLPKREMREWAYFVSRLYKKDPEGATKAMLATLTKNAYGPTTVIRWAEAATRSYGLETYGYNLMVLQFSKWRNEKLDATGLAYLLKRTATDSSTKRDKEIVKTFANFIKKN